MKALFDAMLAAVRMGESAVLCSIVASSGSTPRGAGAKMAVFENGDAVGTIGGGAVEHIAIGMAADAFSGKPSFIESFNLSPDQTADIGMVCGGHVTVAFCRFDADKEALLAEASALIDANKAAWLVTELADGGVKQVGLYADGALRFADIAKATVSPLLKSRAVLTKGEPAYYAEPLTRPGTVYVFGGGHVSQELVPVLAHIGFRVSVYEDRERFADTALFPTASAVMLAPYGDAAKRLTVTADDLIVIMTRGHMADFELLTFALNTDAAYIGMIGSRHKVAYTNARLAERGFDDAAIGRIHSPIGLDIGAETPAEIAISIAAQLIEFRTRREAVI